MRYLMFTFHKAGSMVQHRYLGWLAEITGLPHHSLNYREDEPARRRHGLNSRPTEADQTWWQDTARHLHGIVGPIRRPAALPDDVSDRVVIAVRDPRDALTSLFYSRAISHGGVADDLRRAWLDMGIDRFVMEHLPDLKDRLVKYRAMLEVHPGWPLLRYEDMVLRFDQWFDKLLKGFGLEPDPVAVAAFVAKEMEQYRMLVVDRQLRERPDLHIRSVAPGDHRKKLRHETVAAIEAALADELAFFGYASSGDVAR